MKNFFKSVGLQFCGIVGAGIFALPYIFYNSNFGFAVILIVGAGILMFVLNSFYITIITKTKGDHQLSGYAKIHLGLFGEFLSLFSLVFLCFGAILAYVKLAATFLNTAFGSFSILNAAIFFIFLIGFLHLIRFRLSKTIVSFLPVVNILIILVLFWSSLKFGDMNLNINKPSFFGLGAIIFALSGFTIIPEMEEVLRSNKNKRFWLRLSSLIGLMAAMIVYLAFAYAVIVISGGKVSADAIGGVFSQNYLFGYMLIFFGLATVLTASLNLMLVLKEIFHQDLKMSNNISYFLSFLVPMLTLFFINISFIDTISIVGMISTVLSAIIICLIRVKI